MRIPIIGKHEYLYVSVQDDAIDWEKADPERWRDLEWSERCPVSELPRVGQAEPWVFHLVDLGDDERAYVYNRCNAAYPVEKDDDEKKDDGEEKDDEELHRPIEWVMLFHRLVCALGIRRIDNVVVMDRAQGTAIDKNVTAAKNGTFLSLSDDDVELIPSVVRIEVATEILRYSELSVEEKKLCSSTRGVRSETLMNAEGSQPDASSGSIAGR